MVGELLAVAGALALTRTEAKHKARQNSENDIHWRNLPQTPESFKRGESTGMQILSGFKLLSGTVGVNAIASAITPRVTCHDSQKRLYRTIRHWTRAFSGLA